MKELDPLNIKKSIVILAKREYLSSPNSHKEYKQRTL